MGFLLNLVCIIPMSLCQQQPRHQKKCIQMKHLSLLFLEKFLMSLYILVNKRKKFCSRGGKDGALKAMKGLEEGMGNLVLKKSKGSVKVQTVL